MRRHHYKPYLGERGAVSSPAPTTNGIAARYEYFSHGGSTWFDLTPTPANGTDSTAIVATITGISTSGVGLPGVVTTAAPHGLADDTRVLIYGVTGMTAVNNTLFTVKAAAATTFEMYTAENTPVPFDTSGLPAYTGGGVASQGALSFPYFDGTSSISLGVPAKLDFAGAFTLCVWGNMDMVTPPIQGNEAMIYKGGRGDPDPQNLFMTITDTNGQVTSAIYKPGYTGIQSGAGFGGAWNYFVFVNEGVGGDLKLFINGALINTTVGGGGVTTLSAGVPWYFGRTHAQNLYIDEDWYQGQIDTGRFYSRALSADEILKDYNAGKPVHP